MKNIILSFVLVVALMISGCGANSGSDGIKPASQAPEISEASQDPAGSDEIKLSSEVPEEIPLPEITPNAPPDAAPSIPGIEQRLENLEKDAYPDIEIDAFIRERSAILPGFAIPVTVTVKNTGSQIVDYVHGSGSYETPEAVLLSAEDLQTVLPKDHLGPAITMDFRVNTLNPGDELQFVMYLMALEPYADFDKLTFDTFFQTNEYIADIGPDRLQSEFPELVPAQPGSYNAHAYFIYSLRDSSGIAAFTGGPSGYAEYDFQVSVM